jgi:hypothetical protein
MRCGAYLDLKLYEYALKDADIAVSFDPEISQT